MDKKHLLPFFVARHTHTHNSHAIKNQSPSPEDRDVTSGRDLQIGLCHEASQIMFYSLKVFLAVKEKAPTQTWPVLL